MTCSDNFFSRMRFPGFKVKHGVQGRVVRPLFIFLTVFFSQALLSHEGETGDLSPARWPEGELARLWANDSAEPTGATRAEGDHGLVVTTSFSTAARAGLEALKQGGSAVDAALTTALTQIAMNLGSWSSYGGMLDMVVYDAKSGKVHTLNGAFHTVRGETDPTTLPTEGPSGRAVMVPGFMAAVEAAHRRFGKLPFSSLFDPAIHIAEQGMPLIPYFPYMFVNRKEILLRLPETRAIFTKEDGSFYQGGDLFKQPVLAKTLREVADHGASYMYEGPWAEKLVKLVLAEGGRLTMADMKSYRPVWGEPLVGRFQDFEVQTMAEPNLAGLELVLEFHLLELAMAEGMGDYRRDGEALFRLIQISRVGPLLALLPMRTYFQPEQLLGEMDLSFASLSSKQTAAALWLQIKAPDWETRVNAALTPPETSEHSDAVLAADRFGNIVALTHTINALPWGESGYFVDGVSVADAMFANRAMAQRLKVGARMPDLTNPLLVMKSGKPVAASAAIGRALHEITLQSLLDIMAYDATSWSAAEGPRFLTPAYGQPANERRRIQRVYEDAFPPEVLDKLKALGREIELVPRQAAGGVGYWVGLTVDSATGRFKGACSPTAGGGALAY